MILLCIIKYLSVLWLKYTPLGFAFLLKSIASLNYCRRARWALLVVALQSLAAHSIEMVVHDQQGNPLANAIVVLVGSPFKASLVPTIIDQVDKQFLPKVIAVPVGQYVSFPNSDNIRHHVYSFSKNNPFEIKLYAGRAAQPIVFNHAGAVVIGCNIHDDMVGYIFVSEHWAGVTNAKGIVEIPDFTLSQSLGVWHPRQHDDLTKVNYQTIETINGEGKNNNPLVIPVRPDKKNKINSTFKDRFSYRND